jgi:hypothetical protein
MIDFGKAITLMSSGSENAKTRKQTILLSLNEKNKLTKPLSPQGPRSSLRSTNSNNSKDSLSAQKTKKDLSALSDSIAAVYAKQAQAKLLLGTANDVQDALADAEYVSIP